MIDECPWMIPHGAHNYIAEAMQIYADEQVKNNVAKSTPYPTSDKQNDNIPLVSKCTICKSVNCTEASCPHIYNDDVKCPLYD